jgi:hypothetical protein
MPGMSLRAAAAAGAVAVLAVALAQPVAAAPAPPWNGWYEVTFQTDRKTGTSNAAQQPEEAYTAWYRFATDCSAGPCVATVVDGPSPKENVDAVTTFEWTGTQWSRTNSWRWDCLLPDRTITFEEASSVTTYTPQGDGSLTGTFATNIGSGACEGTVYIPIVAVPADGPTV